MINIKIITRFCLNCIKQRAFTELERTEIKYMQQISVLTHSMMYFIIINKVASYAKHVDNLTDKWIQYI